MRYDRRLVTEFIVRARSADRHMGEHQIREIVRAYHPGVSDWMIRVASKDARLIMAIIRAECERTGD